MKIKIYLFLVASSMWVASVATAAITCNISSAGFATTYPTASPTVVVVPASYTISCARSLGSDPLTTTYTVRANNGLDPSGSNNRSQSGANRLRYDLYSDSSCTTDWRTGVGFRLPNVLGTITMVGLATTTVTQNYWACIQAGISRPAGTYTDTVTMSPIYSAGVVATTGTFSVSIVTPPTCSISSGPGALNIGYTAFQGGPASANTNMDVTCSATLPYTMAVSPAIGVLTGIQYALSLPGSATGTGAAQTHTITGTAAGLQAGACSGGPCTATQLTTVTVTY